MKNQKHYNNASQHLGEIQITTEVLETIAGKAATEVKGVHDDFKKYQKEMGNFFGMNTRGLGAQITDDAHGMIADVNVRLDYGYSVPDVAIKVQNYVREQVLFMTGLYLKEVNVHVISIAPEVQSEEG